MALLSRYWHKSGSIYCVYVPGPVAKYIAKSEYNAAFNARIYLAHFRMLNNELKNKDPDMVLYHAPLIILDGKSAVCIDMNGKETKQTIHISIRMKLVINGGR